MSAQGWVIFVLIGALVFAVDAFMCERSKRRDYERFYKEADAGWEESIEGWKASSQLVTDVLCVAEYYRRKLEEQ